ncbi:hypothetical protein C8J56DRAFT_907368 [Mycena floridula]|nr:hypothetical protein C8J56DRAFT_907368 [Mycena floridula]
MRAASTVRAKDLAPVNLDNEPMFQFIMDQQEELFLIAALRDYINLPRLRDPVAILRRRQEYVHNIMLIFWVKFSAKWGKTEEDQTVYRREMGQHVYDEFTNVEGCRHLEIWACKYTS